MTTTFEETGTSQSVWTDKHTGVAGIVFAVLLVAGIVTAGSTPDYTAADAEWISWYEDSGNTRMAVFSIFLTMFAVVALIAFVGGLAQRMRADSGRQNALQVITVAGGIVMAAAMLIGGILVGGAAGSIEFTDFPVPEADVLKMVEQTGYAILLLGTGAGSFLLLGGASLVSRQTGMFPTWLAIAGIVAAFLLIIGSAVFLPMILLPLWAVAVSVVLLRQKA